MIDMREHLYRGRKSTSKQGELGEWVTGSLVVDTWRNLCFIVYSPHEGKPPISIPVIPETVCQFTGLTDVNGVKVFEGDIVQFKHSEWFGNELLTRTVVFHEELQAFGFPVTTSGQPKYPLENYLNLLAQVDDGTITVIGNVHDNPESNE